MFALVVPVAILFCACQEPVAPVPNGDPATLACPDSTAGVPVAAPVTATVQAPDEPAGKPTNEPANDAAGEDAVRLMLKDYLQSFNTRDADAVAAFWTPDAVAVDEQTGERTSGREALRAEMAAFFEANPEADLRAGIDSVRLIRPDVAEVDGRTSLKTADDEVTDGGFRLVLVREEDGWRIDSLREFATPAPPEAVEALRALDWLLGVWQTENGAAAFAVRPAGGGAFFIRTFAERNELPPPADAADSEATPADATDSDPTNADADAAEGAAVGDATTVTGWVASGTQVIGWDAAAGQIRSWTFHADGSFGEGRWSPSEDGWLIKATQTLADGRTAAGTYVLKQAAADDGSAAITIDLVGLSIDGEPQPTPETARLVRIPADPAPRRVDVSEPEAALAPND